MSRPAKYVDTTIGYLVTLVGLFLNTYDSDSKEVASNMIQPVLDYKVKFPIELMEIFDGIIQKR